MSKLLSTKSASTTESVSTGCSDVSESAPSATSSPKHDGVHFFGKKTRLIDSDKSLLHKFRRKFSIASAGRKNMSLRKQSMEKLFIEQREITADIDQRDLNVVKAMKDVCDVVALEQAIMDINVIANNLQDYSKPNKSGLKRRNGVTGYLNKDLDVTALLQQLPTEKPLQMSAPPRACTDMFQQAIYYHESNELSASVYCLACIARENPLALYLLSIFLRHGLGIDEDKQLAFQFLLCSTREYLRHLDVVTEERGTLKWTMMKKLSMSKHDGLESFSISRASSTTTKQPSPATQEPKSNSEDSSDAESPAASESSEGTLLKPTPTVDYDLLKSLIASSIFEVGICFYHGYGVHHSHSLAFRFFTFAGQMGDVDAWMELGNCYFNGIGCPRSKLSAAQCYRKAVANMKTLPPSFTWIYKEKYDIPGEESIIKKDLDDHK